MHSNNENKKVIIASDFDGTLTTRDTLIEFIRYCHGTAGLMLHLLRVSPWVVLMLLRLYSNHKAKERLLHNCFGGMTQEDLERRAEDFAHDNQHLLRHTLLNTIQQAEASGAAVVVITASAETWVKKMLPSFHVAGTQLEFAGNRFTGRFLTPNCYGAEKVRRLEECFPLLKTERQNYHVIVYGDSNGDRQLMEYADESHLIKSKEEGRGKNKEQSEASSV